MPRYRLPRRQVLASLGAAPVVSLLSTRADAVMASNDGAAPAIESQWVLDIVLDLRLTTPATAARGSALILGGRAAGPLLDGVVLPGSVEWSLDAERAVLRWTAHYDLQAGATRVHVTDRAAVLTSAAGCWNTPFPTAPELQWISGPVALGNALHLGRMDASDIDAGRLRMNVHRVL